MLYQVYLMGYLLICLTPYLDLVPVHQKRRRLVMERHDHDQKEWLDADLIGSYDALSRSASDHLADSFPLFLIKPCSDNIRMYGMQHIEDNYTAVIVTFVLRGIDDMTVYAFIKAPNDTAYKRWNCHSGLKLLCKLCRTSSPPALGARFTVFWGMPAMRTRWMAGAVAHKSGRCRDQSRSDNSKQESLEL